MEDIGGDGDGGIQVVLKRTWAPSIANGQISHGCSVATGIVTANAGRAFVTGARDGDSDGMSHEAWHQNRP